MQVGQDFLPRIWFAIGLSAVSSPVSGLAAGFGALTPYRPLFIALTASSLAYTHACYKNRRRTAVAAALALALTSTPELVRQYNLGKGSVAAPAQILQVQVTGLKCESCAARLKQAVQSALPESSATCSMQYFTGILAIHGSRLQYDDLLIIIRTQGFDASPIGQPQAPNKGVQAAFM